MHDMQCGMLPQMRGCLAQLLLTASALQCVQAWEAIHLSLTPIVELNDTIACAHRPQSARELFIADGGCRYVHQLLLGYTVSGVRRMGVL